MNKLAQVNRPKLLELLRERLAFERASVKLYDEIIAKLRQLPPDSGMDRVAEQLATIRDKEMEHEQWLATQISLFGGDPDELTPRVQLVEIESRGIGEIVSTDPNLSHMFHALLMAELGDHAGWELLLELADFADDPLARQEFGMRLQEEDRHLLFVQELVENLARREGLGQEQPLPELM